MLTDFLMPNSITRSSWFEKYDLPYYRLLWGHKSRGESDEYNDDDAVYILRRTPYSY